VIQAWLKIIAGEAPLPEDITERADLVEFADAHHVLGQMAFAWSGRTKGKLTDVLDNGLLRTGFDHRMLAFEMDRVERALLGSGISPILLKGAAYVATGIKAGEGRRVSDIDILVSPADLEQVEKLLFAAGWAFDTDVNNDYDLHYYRKYMHELPPLRHARRRTIIDVHHSLLPRTSKVKIRSDLILDAAVPLKGRALKTLTPVDLFIHSAVHSFADGSFDTPARSLLELNYLLQGLSSADQDCLAVRAAEVGAQRPVATALWALDTLFGDMTAHKLCRVPAAGRPANALVRYALRQKLNKVDTAYFAKLILFIRSHFLRMPLHLLIAHLGRKMVRNLAKRLKREPQPTS
jgi:Uncharacterised nucleotidyltransferase